MRCIRVYAHPGTSLKLVQTVACASVVYVGALTPEAPLPEDGGLGNLILNVNDEIAFVWYPDEFPVGGSIGNSSTGGLD